MSSEILYDPQNNLWFQEKDDFVLAGIAIAILKVVGTPDIIRLPEVWSAVHPDSEIGYIESSKTIFSLMVPFDAEVAAVFNIDEPACLGESEDGEIPLVALKPADKNAWREGLVDLETYIAYTAP